MSSADFSEKEELIKKYKLHDKDSGSPEVQIALLTGRLEYLSKHFQKHPQDKHSRRGLLRIVSQRKRLLNYLKNEDISRYRAVLSEFGLRK